VNRFLGILVCLSGAGLFTASVAQADIVIDAFQPDDYQAFKLTDSSPGMTSVAGVVASTNVLGGVREVQVSRTLATAATVGVIVYDKLYYSSAQNAGGKAVVVYDGGGAGLGNKDLTEGGANNMIEVGVSSDLGATAEITVYTDSGNYSKATIPIPADPTFTSHSVIAYFGATTAANPILFTAAGGIGATFTKVNAVTITILGPTEAVDVQVDYFVASQDVPPQGPPTEPPTIQCSDVTVQVSKCATSAVVTYSSVVTVDPNCAPASVQYFPPSGSHFPVGTNAVLVTVTDACGQIATCNFDVIVTKEVCQPKPPCTHHSKPPCYQPKPPGHNPPKPPCHNPPKPACNSSGGWFSSFFSSCFGRR